MAKKPKVVIPAPPAPGASFQIDSNAKSHTDVVLQIQEIQKQLAQANPTQNQGAAYDFTKSHLHIGLPCYGGMLYESTMTSLIKFILLAGKVGLNWSLDTMTNESLVTRARNNLMAKMRANTAATHYMFIDSDIRFDAESILQMMAANKEIIAGLYPKKCLPEQLNLNLKRETKLQGPLFTADTVATGFLMFKREVYEKLIEAHPDTKYVDDVGLGGGQIPNPYEPNMYAIFDCKIDAQGHYLSEDWLFCRRASAIGYDIWVDSRVVLNHTGTYEFKGNPALFNGMPKAPPAA